MGRFLLLPLALVTLGVGIPGQALTVKAMVQDQAEMFSVEAANKAEETLRRVQRRSGWDVVIHTVGSLDGQTVRDRAIADAKEMNLHGLYILISKGDHKVWVEPSRSAETVFPKPAVKAIVESLDTAFRAREFDRGLLAAVEKIQDVAQSSTDFSGTAIETDKPANREPARTPPRPAASVEGKFNPVGRGSGKSTPHLPSLLLMSVGAVVMLWLIGRMFRRATRSAEPAWSAPPEPQSPAPGPMPMPRPVPPGGPAPSYGPPTYPAGPGYAAPPPAPAQGGGFLSGALGGLGGAVVGNILYDKFGRPHPAEGMPQGDAGGFPPSHSGHEGAVVPPSETTSSEPPPESYDPDAGAGGDWGGPLKAEAEPPEETNDAGAGADWGGGDSDEPPASEETGDGGADWGDTESGGDGAGQGDGGSW